MKTILMRLTRGDDLTSHGGIVLRVDDENQFMAHHFTREPGSREPKSLFLGAYGDEEVVVAAYAEKLARCRRFTGGGSLISRETEEFALSEEA